MAAFGFLPATRLARSSNPQIVLAGHQTKGDDGWMHRHLASSHALGLLWTGYEEMSVRETQARSVSFFFSHHCIAVSSHLPLASRRRWRFSAFIVHRCRYRSRNLRHTVTDFSNNAFAVSCKIRRRDRQAAEASLMITANPKSSALNSHRPRARDRPVCPCSTDPAP